MTKMTEKVNWGNGLIMSPRELLKSGHGKIVVTDNFYSPRSPGGIRRAVFVDVISGCNGDVSRGVEVSGYVIPKGE